MGWSGLPAGETTDWQALGFINQFVGALRERQKALGVAPASQWLDRVAGCDVHIASNNAATGGPAAPTGMNWRLFQQAALNVLFGGNFGSGTRRVVRLTDGDEFVGMPSVPIWNAADLPLALLAAGIPGTHFTRKYPRTISNPLTSPGSSGWKAWLGTVNSTTAGGAPANQRTLYRYNGSVWELAADQSEMPDVLTGEGLMQAGDSIGPWVFNELHAWLNLFQWTTNPVSVTMMRQRVGASGGPGVPPATTIAAAKSQAEDAFGDAPWTGSTSTVFGGVGSMTLTERFLDPAGEEDECYAAVVVRQGMYTINLGTLEFPHSLYLYMVLNINQAWHPDEYDAGQMNPEDDGGRNLISLVKSFEAEAIAERVTDWLVSEEPTGWPEAEPPFEDPVLGADTNARRGFAVDSVTAVARWNVAGGFQYI